MSPVVGKLVGRSSPKLWIQSGLLLTGLMTVIFGFLDRAPSGYCFITLAFLIRILGDIGAASFTTPGTSCLIISCICSSIYHTSTSIGAFLGPSLGGMLLDQFGCRQSTFFPFTFELLLMFRLKAFILMNKLKLSISSYGDLVVNDDCDGDISPPPLNQLMWHPIGEDAYF